MLITGLIIREATVRAIPVRIRVLTPFSKTKPDITKEIRYKVTELIRKYLIARLIIFLV
jgi:hypothetical protein